MELGNFKVGTEVMVQILDDAIPNVKCLTAFTSTVSNLSEEDGWYTIEFENKVLVRVTKERYNAGAVQGMLG